jgi:hypothetical protein
MWVKFDRLSVQENYFSIWDSSSNRYVPFKASDDYIWWWTNSWSFSSNFSVSTGTWYHIVNVYNGSTAYIYINGVLRNSQSVANFTLANNSQTVYIGSDAGDIILDGSIDDVRVYNYALTGKQIEQLYNQGSSVRFGP